MAKPGRKSYKIMADIACPNQSCPEFGQPGAPGLVANGSYPTKTGKGQRYLCRTCGQSFCSRTGSLFHDLHSPDERIVSALKLLLKGVTIRATAELLAAKPDTIRAWLRRAAQNRQSFTARLLEEPGITPAELDALWQAYDHHQLRQRATLWRQRRGWKK